jgi:hypothetical protein
MEGTTRRRPKERNHVFDPQRTARPLREIGLEVRIVVELSIIEA